MRKSTRIVAAVVTLVCTGVAFVQAAPATNIGLHLASFSPVEGFQARTHDGGAVYVSPRAALTESALLSVDTPSPKEVAVSLSQPGVRSLEKQLRRDNMQHIAVLAAGRVISVGPFTFGAPASSLTLSGLSPSEADFLRDVITTTQKGALVTLVPSKTHVLPNSPVTVDVYVSGLANLRTYQITMADPWGGKSGELTLTNIETDTTRSDYVYGKLAAIAAPDFTGHRMGGVLMNGAVDATQGDLYLGTVTYVPSPKAQGKFRISVEVGARASLLWTGDNAPVAFDVKSVVINVGNRTTTTTTDR